MLHYAETSERGLHAWLLSTQATTAGVCIEEIDAPVLRLAAVSSIPLLQQILLPALNSLLSVQCAPVDKLTLSGVYLCILLAEA